MITLILNGYNLLVVQLTTKI